MRAAIVERTRLSLAVCLNEETSEVRHQLVYLLCLFLPPTLNKRILRIGRFHLFQSFGRTEVDRQVNPNAPRAQYVGNLLYLLQVVLSEDLGRGVDVIQYRSINTYGCTSFGVTLKE